MALILVVEDNKINRELVSEVLGYEGHDVREAADAEEALDLIHRFPPDLILMDIALPGMDGLTLTRQLKSADNTRHIPVVALTAFAMKGDKQKAIDAGCDGYLTKPINTRELPDEVIRYLLDRGNPQREEAS